MPDSIDETRPPRRTDDASLGEVIEFVKTYAKQETLGPLKGAGSWLLWGVIGAFAIGLGLVLVMFGLLRAVQNEWDRSSSGALSWLAYLIVLVVTAVLLLLTVARIKKTYLNNEPLPSSKK